MLGYRAPGSHPQEPFSPTSPPIDNLPKWFSEEVEQHRMSARKQLEPEAAESCSLSAVPGLFQRKNRFRGSDGESSEKCDRPGVKVLIRAWGMLRDMVW